MTFILALLIEVSNCFSALPQDAEKFLQSLPERSITLDLVIRRAIGESDSFKEIQSASVAADAPRLFSEAVLDTRVNLKGNRLLDENEAATPFSPAKNHSTFVSMGVSKTFVTGTTAVVELSQSSTNLGFQTIPNLNYFEGKLGLGLKQSLWKDFFGYATRRAIDAAELTIKANDLAIGEAREDWYLGISGVFFRTWFAQAQARATIESLNRRQRLLEITKIKFKRGNSDQTDVLQVESALINAKVQSEQAKQKLVETWRGLVTTLKLPGHWIAIDPMEIPISLTDETSQAIAACKALEPKALKSESHRLKKLRHLAESARANLDKSSNLKSPDLSLSASYYSNGIDADNSPIGNQSNLSRSSQEAFRLEHPKVFVGLELSLPIEFSAENAALAMAQSEKLKADYKLSQESDRFDNEWLNACSDLERLEAANRSFREASEKQLLRSKLEESRFRFGNTSTLSVIQAGDDATQYQLLLSQNETERRIAALRVLTASGDVKKKIDGLVQ